MSARGGAGHRLRGRDEADEQPAMLGALAHGPDAGDVRPQRVVDEHAAVDLDAHAAREARLGHDAGRDDHEIRLDRLAACQLDAVGVDRRRHASQATSMPCSRSARSSIRPAVASSWRSISWPARWTTVTAMPRLATARAASGQQPAADDDGAARAVGAAANRADVVAAAEGDRPLDPSIGGRKGREPVARTSAS